MLLHLRTAGDCLRRLAAFAAIFLSALLCSAGDLAAASGTATEVQTGNGNAYVIVLPENMPAEERDELLKKILAGQDSATPAEVPEDETFLAQIDEDFRKIRDAVAVALKNTDRAYEVPLRVLQRLESSPGAQESAAFVLFLFALTLFGGLIVEVCFRRFIWKAAPLPPEADMARYTDRMKLGLKWLSRELAALIVFWGGAVLLFHAIYRLEDPGRHIVISIISTVTLVRILVAVSGFILAPGETARRLMPFSDHDARSCHTYIVVLVTLSAIFLKPAMLADYTGGVDPEARAAYGVIFGALVVVLAIVLVLRLRRPVSAALLAAAPRPGAPTEVRRWAAGSWHHVAAAAFVAIYIITIYMRVSHVEGSLIGAAFGTMGLILLTPFVIRSLRLLLDEYYAKRSEEQRLAPSALRRSFEIALQRMVPVIVIVCALIILGMLWGVSIFNLKSLGIGARIYDATVDIGIILIIAYFVWELVRGAIDQRLAEERHGVSGEGGVGGEEDSHAPASRISTLLPLFRTTLMIVMVLVVIFVVLSEMGVNVGPLIAGAGVVGIALGFGAQTLVTDVISGIFFLVDDAFRRGEYIDVGVAKGTVEKISLRSLQLSHHNGPVNTVPFGQIATVNNFSRDWAIIKLEIRVPFETDVNQVRKLVKKIGQEMMEDPALADMMLEPLKSQGVVRVDDSALIIRCKFTAKPGQQFLVRREAFTRIQKRFAEEGIHFAPRRVIVDAPTPELTKAATAALDSDQLVQGGGGDER